MPRAGWTINGKFYTTDEALAKSREKGAFYRFTPAQWVALQRQTQRTDGWWLSPSGATGCKRQHILKATEDYWLKPTKVWAMVVGTGCHSMMETGLPGFMEEQRLRMTINVPLVTDTGTEWVDFPIQGTLDLYEPDYRRVTDYKFPSEFDYWDSQAKTKVTKEFPEDRHVFQVNVYRMLCEANDLPVELLQIAYARPYKDAPRKPVDVPLWDLEETYEMAVEAAIPLVRAWKLHELPECTCEYGNHSMDRDLCETVDDDEWKTSRRWERVPEPGTYVGTTGNDPAYDE